MIQPDLTHLENQLAYLDELNAPCREWVDVLNDMARGLADTAPARAHALSKRALWLSSELRYAPGEIRALTLLAWINMVEGRMDLALTRALNAEAVARVAREPSLEGHALYVMAMVHDQVGNFDEALKVRQKMIVVARESGDVSLEANCLLTMGMQHSRHNEHRKALGCYMKSLTLYRRMNRSVSNQSEERSDDREVMALNNVASALIGIGDVWLALRYAQNAQALCNTNNVRVYTQILHTLGNVHAAMGQLDESLTHFTRALDLNTQAAQDGYITDREFEATLQLDVAKVQRARNQRGPAFAALQRALEVAQAIDAKPLLAQAHDQLSKAYRETGQVALALVHAEQREAVRASFRQIINDQHERVIRVMAILQASRRHVHQEQCQAAHEWLWKACLHGNAATC